MERSGKCQVVMATHAPLLMSYPGATLLRLEKYGLEPVQVEDTEHFRLLSEYCADPHRFVAAVLEE